MVSLNWCACFVYVGDNTHDEKKNNINFLKMTNCLTN